MSIGSTCKPDMSIIFKYIDISFTLITKPGPTPRTDLHLTYNGVPFASPNEIFCYMGRGDRTLDGMLMYILLGLKS